MTPAKEQQNSLLMIGNLAATANIYEPNLARIPLPMDASDCEAKSASGANALGALGFWNSNTAIVFREIRHQLIPATVCLILGAIAFMMVCAL